jgi:hypothetical protein
VTPEGPLVRVTPDLLRLGVGSEGKTQVDVVDIENLYGTELRIEYDPAVVEVVDVNPDTAGVQVAPGDVFATGNAFIVENHVEEGVITFIAARRSPDPSFTGTGSLVEITWRGHTRGQSPVTLESVKLSDSEGRALAATPLDGEIRVGTGVIIRGRVELEGNGDTGKITISAGDRQLKPVPDGSFEVELDGDSYELLVTAQGYLSARLQGDVVAGSTTVEVGLVKLPGGEVTGDDEIDIFDLAFIGSRYGGTDSSGDVNGDGVIDIFDLAMSASNYGKQGPVGIGLNSE